uniref:Uncharacterized protein n=1 Tax=Knipowitschia caucasica TaxID=637954 RepID=A0AAV2JZ03_KNICA
MGSFLRSVNAPAPSLSAYQLRQLITISVKPVATPEQHTSGSSGWLCRAVGRVSGADEWLFCWCPLQARASLCAGLTRMRVWFGSLNLL